MSAFERFLLLGIIFLLIVRTAFFTEDVPTLEDNPDAVRSGQHIDQSYDTPSGVIGRDSGTAGGYEWKPSSFTRRGIPSKLTLAPDGRIPDALRLNDTQKAFIYATMVATHDSLLERAKRDCPPDMNRDIVRWQARNRESIAAAKQVLNILAPGREAIRKSHETMAKSLFTKRICPTIEHYLRTGSYDPHAEAVDRLIQAADRINAG
tara:strand:+ start:569 stop:1189 length:621 start_codon:yes stop_codon:yes gene_type:complete